MGEASIKRVELDQPAPDSTDARRSERIYCPECGASARARCDCGVAYIPAREYARRAIEANPEKSDRAIAEQTGLGANTVRRARGLTAPNGAVEKRIGRDGKTRKMPTRAAKSNGSHLPSFAEINKMIKHRNPPTGESRDQIVALLNRLGSDDDDEVLEAARAVEALRRKLGKEWEYLIRRSWLD